MHNLKKRTIIEAGKQRKKFCTVAGSRKHSLRTFLVQQQKLIEAQQKEVSEVNRMDKIEDVSEPESESASLAERTEDSSSVTSSGPEKVAEQLVKDAIR